MGRKTVEESEQTRLKLMEAGTRIFAKHGFAYSTLNDIAHFAGLSRGAVYWHFKGKWELLQSIMNAAVLPLEEFFVASAPTKGLEHLLKALGDTLCVQHHRDLCTILLKDGEIGLLECPVVVRWRVAQENLRVQLKLLLRARQPAGMRSQEQLDALAHLIALSITGLITESLHNAQSVEKSISPLVQALRELLGCAGAGVGGH
uniref:TetR family regulatory protein n=1 Tax=Pseudomonas fluorescens TaxID=294 RepID=B1GRM7_PSEFL|nr:TetR family regulatory protein [Pseudomonas fluorescens]